MSREAGSPLTTRNGRLDAFAATRLAAAFFATFADFLDVLLAIAFTPRPGPRFSEDQECQTTGKPVPFSPLSFSSPVAVAQRLGIHLRAAKRTFKCDALLAGQPVRSGGLGHNLVRRHG